MKNKELNNNIMTKKTYYIIVAGMIILHSSFFTLHSHAQRIVSLSECISTMRKSNIKASSASNNVRMAEELKKYARTKYFPSVSVKAMHYEATEYLIKKDLFSQELTEAIDQINAQYNLGIDTSIALLKRATSGDISFLQPLYTGGRITSANKLADLNVDAMKTAQDFSDDLLVMEAEIMYFTLVKLHGKQQTLATSDAELSSILKDARNLASEGIVNSNDVLSVELAQDELNVQRLRLDNAVRTLRRLLAKEMGCPNEDIDVDTTLITTDVTDPQALWTSVEEAVDNSNENHLLNINVERTRLQTRLAKASYLPVFALGGTFGVSHYLSKSNVRGIGFATVVMPISSFWSERHMVRRSKIEEQKALDQQRDKRQSLNIQVLDAFDNLTASYQQVAIARKSIVRAEENLRIKHEEYINGVTNMSPLLEARRQHQTAHDGLSDALCDYHHARTKYLILTGRKAQTYTQEK